MFWYVFLFLILPGQGRTLEFIRPLKNSNNDYLIIINNQATYIIYTCK